MPVMSSYSRDGGFASFLAIRRSVETLRKGVLLGLVYSSEGSMQESEIVAMLDPLLNFLQWKATDGDIDDGALSLADIVEVSMPSALQVCQRSVSLSM